MINFCKCHHATLKCNQLNEVAQYKTVCSRSLLQLHNAVGGVLWSGNRLCLSLCVMVLYYTKFKNSCLVGAKIPLSLLYREPKFTSTV